MFDKILIANRGEIACRVIKTARKLGIRTVAVYSEADAGAMHVDIADEAVLIGPAPARESYLVPDKILEAARRTGAQAIHPGYGFLSENAAFADACQAAGITFIGPPASAIRAMGSKSAAKALMEKTKVPLVPGYHGDDQKLETLQGAALGIGFPVLIKASAGGGGKGMRIVTKLDELDGAIASAKREAASSFGDDQLLIEKYLTKPRHIEIQVFADTQGNAVYLFERDCSIQRRHQKVIEEAPAPHMPAERRKSMGEAACAAARAIGYVGAGTVEFIAEGDHFYFMEMNTRLQVEHPVTEAITGQDLVEWQLIVAAGGRLPLLQDQLAINGHAFEARIYAEDPDRGFIPSIGTISHLQTPAETATVRIDTGVRAGDTISVHYDPMIAKLIVWGKDRAQAAQGMSRALAQVEIAGLHTNVAFLKRLMDHPAFRAGDVDTGFIERHKDILLPASQPLPPAVVCAAALRIARDAVPTPSIGDPYSPWNTATAWRIGGADHRMLQFRHGEETISVRLTPLNDGYTVAFNGVTHVCGTSLDPLTIDGLKTCLGVVRKGADITVILDGASHTLRWFDPLAVDAADSAGAGHLVAPMPGRVTQVIATPGATVKKGDALIVLEAMKMEHVIKAPADGTVDKIHYAVGDIVAEGKDLVAFSAT